MFETIDHQYWRFTHSHLLKLFLNSKPKDTTAKATTISIAKSPIGCNPPLGKDSQSINTRRIFRMSGSISLNNLLERQIVEAKKISR